MPDRRRRLFHLPAGLPDAEASQLFDALAEAVRFQRGLASRSGHVLNFQGELQRAGGQFFVEHEPADPVALSDLLNDQSPKPGEQELLEVTSAIFDALRAAHEAPGGKSALHGGLCPGVLLRDTEGVWKLTDFGFAPAVCKSLGQEQYIHLAVASALDRPSDTGVTGSWEILPADEYSRDDRICAFVDPEKFAQAINAPRAMSHFSTHGDVFAAGCLVYLLSEHWHPYFRDVGVIVRSREEAEQMASLPPTKAIRAELRGSSNTAIGQVWVPLLLDELIAHIPSRRPVAAAVVQRLSTWVKPRPPADVIGQAVKRAEHILGQDRLEDAEREARAILDTAADLTPDQRRRLDAIVQRADEQRAKAEQDRIREELAVELAACTPLLAARDWQALEGAAARILERGQALTDEMRQEAEGHFYLARACLRLEDVLRLLKGDEWADAAEPLASILRTRGLPGGVAEKAGEYDRLIKHNLRIQGELAEFEAGISQDDPDSAIVQLAGPAEKLAALEQRKGALDGAIGRVESWLTDPDHKLVPAIAGRCEALHARWTALRDGVVKVRTAQVSQLETDRNHAKELLSAAVKARRDGEWAQLQRLLEEISRLRQAWPPETEKEVGQLTQVLSRRAAVLAWFSELSSAAASQGWPAALRLLERRPADGREFLSADQLAQVDVHDRTVRENISAQQEATDRFAKAKSEAGRERYRAALALLDEGLQIEQVLPNLASEVEELRKAWRTKAAEQEAARLRAREARACQIAQEFALDVVRELNRIVDPAHVVAAVKLGAAIAGQAEGSRVATIALQYEPVESEPVGLLEQTTEVAFDADSPQLRDPAGLGERLKNELAARLTALQRQRRQEFFTRCCNELFPSLRLQGEVAAPVAEVTTQVDLLGDSSSTGSLRINLKWDAARLIWTCPELSEFVARAMSVAASAVAAHVKRQIVETPEAAFLQLYRDYTTVDVQPDPGRRHSMLTVPQPLPVKGAVSLKIQGDGAGHTLGKIAVTCAKVAADRCTVSASNDIAAAERTLSDWVVKQQEEARQQLASEVEQALLSQGWRKPSVSTDPRRIKTPAATLTLSWKNPNGSAPPPALRAAWNLERSGYALPADWQNAIEPPPKPEETVAPPPPAQSAPQPAPVRRAADEIREEAAVRRGGRGRRGVAIGAVVVLAGAAGLGYWLFGNRGDTPSIVKQEPRETIPRKEPPGPPSQDEPREPDGEETREPEHKEEPRQPEHKEVPREPEHKEEPRKMEPPEEPKPVELNPVEALALSEVVADEQAPGRLNAVVAATYNATGFASFDIVVKAADGRVVGTTSVPDDRQNHVIVPLGQNVDALTPGAVLQAWAVLDGRTLARSGEVKLTSDIDVATPVFADRVLRLGYAIHGHVRADPLALAVRRGDAELLRVQVDLDKITADRGAAVATQADDYLSPTSQLQTVEIPLPLDVDFQDGDKLSVSLTEPARHLGNDTSNDAKESEPVSVNLAAGPLVVAPQAINVTVTVTSPGRVPAFTLEASHADQTRRISVDAKFRSGGVDPHQIPLDDFVRSLRNVRHNDRVRVGIDPDNNVREADEGDNENGTNLRVDVRAESCTLDAANADKPTATLTYKIASPVPAVAPFKIALYFDQDGNGVVNGDPLLDSKNITGAEEKPVCSLSWNAKAPEFEPGKACTLMAQIEFPGWPDGDADAGNNVKTVSWTVPRPRLQATTWATQAISRVADKETLPAATGLIRDASAAATHALSKGAPRAAPCDYVAAALLDRALGLDGIDRDGADSDGDGIPDQDDPDFWAAIVPECRSYDDAVWRTLALVLQAANTQNPTIRSELAAEARRGWTGETLPAIGRWIDRLSERSEGMTPLLDTPPKLPLAHQFRQPSRVARSEALAAAKAAPTAEQTFLAIQAAKIADAGWTADTGPRPLPASELQDLLHSGDNPRIPNTNLFCEMLADDGACLAFCLYNDKAGGGADDKYVQESGQYASGEVFLAEAFSKPGGGRYSGKIVLAPDGRLRDPRLLNAVQVDGGAKKVGDFSHLVQGGQRARDHAWFVNVVTASALKDKSWTRDVVLRVWYRSLIEGGMKPVFTESNKDRPSLFNDLGFWTIRVKAGTQQPQMQGILIPR